METESAEKSRPMVRSNSLTAIELKNFRCYKNLIQFPVKPLTIFTGQNSVGKSTLFKALSLVGDTEGALEMNFSGTNSVSHGIPDFTSVKNFSAKTDDVHFRFQFKDAQFNIEFSPDSEELGSCRVRSLAVVYLPSNKVLAKAEFDWFGADGMQIQGYVPTEFNRLDQPRIFRKFLEVLANSKDLSESRNLDKWAEANLSSSGHLRRMPWDELPSLKATLRGRKRFTFALESKSTGLTSIIREVKRQLRGQLDEPAAIKGDVKDIKERLRQDPDLFKPQQEYEKSLHFITKSSGIFGFEALVSLMEAGMSQFNNVIHLSSKRLVAPRLFQKGDDLYDELSSRSNQLLFSDGKTRRSASRAIEFFNHWMKEMNVGDEVKVENVEGMAVKVNIREGNHWMNLADRGMGFAQVFRLLFTISTAVLKANQRDPLILCIEEPDSNLHPSVQSQLVEPIVDAMSINPNLTIYLETHSEYMVRKLMVMAKEKPELSQDWAVNYLEKEQGTFKVRHVTFGEDGRLSERLGTGFLDEASKLTRELL